MLHVSSKEYSSVVPTRESWDAVVVVALLDAVTSTVEGVVNTGSCLTKLETSASGVGGFTDIGPDREATCGVLTGTKVS